LQALSSGSKLLSFQQATRLWVEGIQQRPEVIPLLQVVAIQQQPVAPLQEAAIR
jgi:hypothetical protein